MLEFLLTDGMRPFSLALSLLIGLILLELLMLVVGGSLLSADADGFDVDADAFDLDLDGTDINSDASILEADGVEGELSSDSSLPALSSWFGFGKVPLAIWVAALLTGFGLSGFILQSVLDGLFGFMLPWMLSIPVAAVPALTFVRGLSDILARLIPKTETAAVSRRSFGGQHGVITQGTARTGQPAEARVKDRHGNTHYLRVEPYDEGTELPQGTEVYVIRKRDGSLRAMEIQLD